ncbi:hypothetical protein evm_002655 [Chilo suppressalis]|nr:hypothetical protein evm_002655 [Chilo suppressalis]
MCLNCLPKIGKCLFCICLRDGVVIISKGGLLLFTPILILLITGPHRLGIQNIQHVNFELWLKVVMVFWILSCVLLTFGWAGCVKNEGSRDFLLQVYFWLVVVTAVLHLIFSVTYLAFCWDKGIVASYIHFVVTVLLLFVMMYALLIVNSYRMSLF